MRRANDDEDIAGLTALNLFTVVAQKHKVLVCEKEFRCASRTRVCAMISPPVHLPVSIFRSLRRNLARRRARHRFADSIIVRFFSCLSVQEQEELARGCANTRLGSRGRYSRKSHAVLRICNARALRILRSGARVPRSVLSRFFPAYSRARRGQIRRARCNRGRNERAEILPAWEPFHVSASGLSRERQAARFRAKLQRGPISSGCVASSLGSRCESRISQFFSRTKGSFSCANSSRGCASYITRFMFYHINCSNVEFSFG